MNDEPQWPNLVAMFFDQADRLGDKPFLWSRHDGSYSPLSWRETAAQVMAIAGALKRHGLQQGDRVILLSQNSPQWAIADFAIMAAGGVTVPVYTTNTARDHRHILADSGAAMAIVSTPALAAPFLEAVRDTGTLRHVIAIEDPGDIDSGSADTSLWHDEISRTVDGEDLKNIARETSGDSLACLIYTSGTGGNPKGVMLSHRAVLSNCSGATEILRDLGLGDEVFLSFLPLSHAYEHTAGLMFPVSLGAQIYFAERIDSLTINMPEAQPTIMTAVPRLYEVMRERILKGVRQQGGMKARLFHKAVDLGRKRIEDPTSLTMSERVIDAVVERLVRDKVRARFGGRLKALVSGGAPLNYEVGTFFAALGLRLLQGYGQTEAAPVISCNPCLKPKLRTVGPPLYNAEVRIADDGEILVRGPLLMDGYWNQPELTAQAIRDGWLHTGDIGEFDEEGYLSITDRKKDIIVSTGGDTISPQHVECTLALEPEIASAMVAGDNRPHLVGIIVPDAAFVHEWAKDHDRSPDLVALSEDPEFRHSIGAAVDRANKSLGATERVKRFIVADEEFTTENSMMTPTMKPRRHQILERWGASIDALY